MTMTADFEQLRDAGRTAADETIASAAPADPLARVAWFAGFDPYGTAVLDAIIAAKDAGHSWRECSTAAGWNMRTLIGRTESERKRRQRSIKSRNSKHPQRDDQADAE